MEMYPNAGGQHVRCSLVFQIVNMAHQFQHSGWGQCRFRLVQYVQTIAAKAVCHQCHEAFAMGLLMQRDTAIAFNHTGAGGWDSIHLIDITGNIIKALCPQEKSVSVTLISSAHGKVFVQIRMRIICGKVEIYIDKSDTNLRQKNIY